jgi:neutral ceramidase
MVTLANGAANSGYIPNDAAFGAQTFQVLGSRLKPGCAETAIVNGLLELIASIQK